MRHAVVLGALALLFGTLIVTAGRGEEPTTKSPALGKVRHVVLFKFKDGTTPEQVKSVEDAFRALPTKIPNVLAYEWGTNMSRENLSQGFTHCFPLTFPNAEARNAYVPHPWHKAFGKVLHPYLDKVLVIDFVAKE